MDGGRNIYPYRYVGRKTLIVGLFRQGILKTKSKRYCIYGDRKCFNVALTSLKSKINGLRAQFRREWTKQRVDKALTSCMLLAGFIIKVFCFCCPWLKHLKVKILTNAKLIWKNVKKLMTKMRTRWQRAREIPFLSENWISYRNALMPLPSIDLKFCCLRRPKTL